MTEPAWITVGEVARDLGVARGSPIVWAAGRAAASIWRVERKAVPRVVRARKSRGSGGHVMVVYPAEWRPVLARLVRLCLQVERSAGQGPRKAPAPRPGKQLPLFAARWMEDGLGGRG